MQRQRVPVLGLALASHLYPLSPFARCRTLAAVADLHMCVRFHRPATFLRCTCHSFPCRATALRRQTARRRPSFSVCIVPGSGTCNVIVLLHPYPAECNLAPLHLGTHHTSAPGVVWLVKPSTPEAGQAPYSGVCWTQVYATWKESRLSQGWALHDDAQPRHVTAYYPAARCPGSCHAAREYFGLLPTHEF